MRQLDIQGASLDLSAMFCLQCVLGLLVGVVLHKGVAPQHRQLQHLSVDRKHRHQIIRSDGGVQPPHKQARTRLESHVASLACVLR